MSCLPTLRATSPEEMQLEIDIWVPANLLTFSPNLLTYQVIQSLTNKPTNLFRCLPRSRSSSGRPCPSNSTPTPTPTPTPNPNPNPNPNPDPNPNPNSNPDQVIAARYSEVQSWRQQPGAAGAAKRAKRPLAIVIDGAALNFCDQDIGMRRLLLSMVADCAQTLDLTFTLPLSLTLSPNNSPRTKPHPNP